MKPFIFGLLLGLMPMAASATPEALAEAIAALDARDYETAAAAQARITDATAADVVTWIRLRQGQGEMSEYLDFIADHDDWPGMILLRREGEQSIPETAAPERVLAYFNDARPRTGTGSLRLAAALWATDQRDAAMAEARRAWTTMSLTAEERDQFMIDWPRTLRSEHEARLDFLLWENRASQARAMYPLVDDGWERLAEARLALRARRNGVNALISAVPAGLRSDPGLNFERFIWRIREGLEDSARELIEASSESAATLGRPLEWANRRRQLARSLMRAGDLSAAYRVAANHQIQAADNASSYSDLEWIAGYTAFRMGQFDTALHHFNDFRAAVYSPISMGRAGYWIGRTQEALGNADAAAEAYAQGAEFQSSFYGQLAAERAGLPTDPAFTGQEDFGRWQDAGFVNSEVFRAGLRLIEAGEMDLGARFMASLVDELSRQDAGRLGDLALELDSPRIALAVAKAAAQAGHVIMRAYYPIYPDLVAADLPVSDRLTLSIARRESEFNPSVISGAGAIGLMQVMPRTGRETAGRLGLQFDEGRMLSDAGYNATLGAGYLAYLIEEFGPNPVLIAAAYNAGPSRARRWSEANGDPWGAEVDIVDWIESIPFRETRNYVMRVTEAMRIYQAHLSGELPRQSLSALLRQR
jgi:peptidoglycan lytic transglycosylase